MPGVPEFGHRPSRIALGQKHRPGGTQRERTKERNVLSCGDPRQFLGGGPGGRDILGGENDLDVGIQRSGPRSGFHTFVCHPADRRVRRLNPPLGQAQLSHPRSRATRQLCCLGVRLLGFGKPAAQPLDFAHLIEGRTQAGLRCGMGKPLPGLLRPFESLLPSPVQLQKLGAPYQAVAAIGNQVRLRSAPAFQRRRPLLRTLQVEDLAAALEHAAINSARAQGRNLARRYRNHRLVEQRHTARDLSLADQRAALPLQPECDQVLFAEPFPDRSGLHKGRMRRDGVTFVKCAVSLRQQQVSVFHTVGASVEQPFGPRKPAACLREFAVEQCAEAHPKRAAGGRLLVAAAQEGLMGARQQVRSLRFLSDQPGRLRKLRQILGVERCLTVRRR